MLPVGFRLGPYEVTAPMRLGTGEAYQAYNCDRGRAVLLQVFRADFAGEPDRIRRFERDIRPATMLEHPNILDIYDVCTDDHAAYIVAEPLTGDTLRARLETGGVPLAIRARCAVQIARALLAARRRRIRHGHLGADHVVLEPDGRAVVVGFGLMSVTPPERVMSDCGAFMALVGTLLCARWSAPGPRVRRRTALTAAMLLGAAAVVAMLTVMRDGDLPEEAATAATLDASSVATPLQAAGGNAPAGAVEPAAPPTSLGDRAVDAPIESAAPVATSPSPFPALVEARARPLAPVVADTRDAASLITEASVRATEFDLAGAADLLRAAASRGDASAGVAASYIGGLLDARAAFRDGGPPDALVSVRQAIAALEAAAKGRSDSAEIARLVLHAAAAAAQSERGEMSLYLETALEMESLQRMAGLPGAPLVTAAEVAGDLWLQVHHYDDARRAYTEAGERVGATLRILSGLARTARRLNDAAGACGSYRRLLDAWGERPGLPVEIAEARAYVGGCAR
ncbi:MAG: hypothetical protein A3I61_18480 [Acidobacteria bacterium RIFCSPLOWO2_02_FULL_68_18]|nr:MAG: hypothetical protein A3I61_18480 [Acidobacteria bacterium RIFCSPLOWO2_02_FULL_68_18]OFW48038.1 MAG: hypothetical protein A3G77_11095 [Acidobacteria bacterium RIFCSPLOWO2_12_FULL_68_19]